MVEGSSGPPKSPLRAPAQFLSPKPPLHQRLINEKPNQTKTPETHAGEMFCIPKGVLRPAWAPSSATLRLPLLPHCFVNSCFGNSDVCSSPLPGFPFPSYRLDLGRPCACRGSTPRFCVQLRLHFHFRSRGGQGRQQRCGPRAPGTLLPSPVRPAGRGLRGWGRTGPRHLPYAGVQGAGRKRTRGLRSGAGGSRGAGDHVRGEGGGVGAGPVLLASLSLFSTGRWTRAQGWCVRSMRSPGCATSRPAGGSLLRSSWRLGSCPPRPPDCRVGPSELVGGLWG